jgi:hypothetical protein
MTRLLTSFIIAVFSLLVVGIPHTNAAGLDTILAPGNPPLTRGTSDASAGVTVFVLKLVATGDVEADDLDLDESMLDHWANAVAASYVRMSADEQAQFSVMPALRDALLTAWPEAADADRAEVRDAFRPLAQGWLSQMECASFVSMAESDLVEPTDENIARYKGCNPADEPIVEAPARTAVTESPTAAYNRASAGLQASHNNYVHMSNVLLQNHVGNMNSILNMGSSNYRYEYKSKP